MHPRLAGLSAILTSRRSGRLLPQTLVFFVTSRCNARCAFCLYGEQVANPVAKGDELTVAEVESIAAVYGPLHYLSLSGGEPFIRHDLEGICQAFIDGCGTAVVNIPSNFSYGAVMRRTLEPLARRNPGVVFDLQMSVDDIGAAHDASRRVPNLYRTAIENARAVARLRERHGNLRLKASILFTDSNRDRVAEIAATLRREVAFDRIQLGYPSGLVGAVPDRIDAFAAATRTLRAPPRRPDAYTAGMRALQGMYHELLGQAIRRERNAGQYCEAGRRIVVIDERGEVFPCEPKWQSIGNLRASGYDMRAILEGDACAKFRQENLGPGRCNCTWSCALLASVPHQAENLPRLGAQAAWTWLKSRGSCPA